MTARGSFGVLQRNINTRFYAFRQIDCGYSSHDLVDTTKWTEIAFTSIALGKKASTRRRTFTNNKQLIAVASFKF